MMDVVRMDYLVSDIVNSNVPECCLKATNGLSGEQLVACDSCRNGSSLNVFNGNTIEQSGSNVFMSTSAFIKMPSHVLRSLNGNTLKESSCHGNMDILTERSEHSLMQSSQQNLLQSISNECSHLDIACKTSEKCSIKQTRQRNSSCKNSGVCHSDKMSAEQCQALSNNCNMYSHYKPKPSDGQIEKSYLPCSCCTFDCCDMDCVRSSAYNETENNNNTLCSPAFSDDRLSPSHQTFPSCSSDSTVHYNSQKTCKAMSRELETSSLSNINSPLSKPASILVPAEDEGLIILKNVNKSDDIHNCLLESQGSEPTMDKEAKRELYSKDDQRDLQHFNNDSGVFSRQFVTCSHGTNPKREITRITPENSRRNLNNYLHHRSNYQRPKLNNLSIQGMRETYHQQSIPKFLAPDLTLPSVIPEDFYSLHDIDHKNNYLSPEVVFSLHFRNYQIKEVLGRGISSTVRRVNEKSTGAEYAVKIIDISGERAELAQVEQVKKDTFREINILRMCAGHSNIIELHDVFETPTFIFLVFEICKRGELFDYLTSVVSLSEKRTRIFMRQLLEAIAFFHDKNIVHRDLKPENILLDDALNIKVSDFGFATVVRPGEQLSELCGTPGYLAPEVLAHSMYDNVPGYSKEVDMWACGVIMYTLLCGAPPFWNRRQMMMLRAIMSADYTFNSSEWDDITETPKHLIRSLLLVNPKDRLTARQALQHPFFETQLPEEKKFKALKKFKAAAYCLIFKNRIIFFYKHPPPVSVQTVRQNPYGVKVMRRVIDTCAFGMYKHWVKRVDNQNRAALFEHTLRDDWKHTMMTVDGLRA